MFKVNNEETRIVDFEQASDIVLVLLSLTLNKQVFAGYIKKRINICLFLYLSLSHVWKYWMIQYLNYNTKKQS